MWEKEDSKNKRRQKDDANMTATKIMTKKMIANMTATKTMTKKTTGKKDGGKKARER